MKHLHIIFALILLVFIAGCTGISGFGGDVLKIQDTVQEEGSKNVLVINDIKTIPHSPLLPDQQMLLSFVVENLDKIKKAENVEIKLFDAPVIKNNNGKCNSIGNECIPSENSKCRPGCDAILPGEQIPIDFDLLTPTEEEIAGIKTDAELKLRVYYDFDASTTMRVPVVNNEEIRARQRAGVTTTLERPVFVGSGPVQINIELMGQPYILGGYDSRIIFKIRDKGDKHRGRVSNSFIDNGKMTIDFGDLKIDENDKSSYPSDKFTCSNNVCVNDANRNGRIDLYEGESIPLYFKIKSENIKEPYKSYEIKASINNYRYEIDDSIKITVNPYDNV